MNSVERVESAEGAEPRKGATPQRGFAQRSQPLFLVDWLAAVALDLTVLEQHVVGLWGKGAGVGMRSGSCRSSKNNTSLALLVMCDLHQGMTGDRKTTALYT